MSKTDKKNAPAEEEWEDVDENEEYEEEEEDTTIANSDVVMRYKKAATWANEVLAEVIKACVVDASVKKICADGDALIKEKVGQMFKGVDKGIAFPTCVNVNSCVAHCNGTEGDVKLQLNDVCKIQLGVHVDGYSALAAQTIQVTATGDLNPESKEAEAIAAGYAVLDAAIRQLRPGQTTTEVSEVIEKASAHFGLNPFEGVLSHQLKRYIIDGWKTIPPKASTDHKVHEYPIEPHTVWNIELVLTTGPGKRLKEKDMKPCLFKQSIEGTYEPKLQASFEARGEINTRFQYFPFSVASMENPKARLGLSELTKHGVTFPLPVLHEKEGEIVVHFGATVFVTPKKIERVASIPIQKGAAPVKPYTDEQLLAKSKLPISLVPKKEKK